MKTKVLLIGIALTAQAWAGKYAAEFLDTGIGVRALGMGGAFVAVADDGSASYWNPAGMMRIARPEATFMHASNFSGLLQSDAVHLVKPSPRYALGLSYLRVGVSDIKYTSRLDLNGRPIVDRMANDVEEALFLSAAKPLGGAEDHGLLLGATVKTLHQRVGDNSALGFGVDVGMQWRAGAWTAAAVLQDLSGTYVYWDTGRRDAKPPRLLWGAAWTKAIPSLRTELLFSVQQVVRFEGRSLSGSFDIGDAANSDIHFGGELQLFRLLAVRAGSAGGDLSAGAGITFRRLRLDYAFMTHDLGNAHRVALTVGL